MKKEDKKEEPVFEEETTESKLEAAIAAIAGIEKKHEDTEQTLKRSIRFVGADVKLIMKGYSKIKAEMERVHKLVQGDLLDKARDDSSEIHHLYRLATLKAAVSTEVYYMHKGTPLGFKLAAAALTVNDYSDKWWGDRAELTMNEWSDLLLKVNVMTNQEVDERQWKLQGKSK